MSRPAIYVVGAGGIGCTIGYRLLEAGKNVVFVEVNHHKIEDGNRNGVFLIGQDEDGNANQPRHAQFVHINDWTPEPDDTVFLCTKCYSNADVLRKLTGAVQLIPVQNGYDPLLESFHHTFEGIASFVATCEANRPVVTITRSGDLHFGPRQSHGSADLFKAWFPSACIVPDIRPIKATKLMYNAAISPLAAAAGVDNGVLLDDPQARKLFFALLKENYAILTGAGVELGKVGPFHPHTVSRILRTPLLARLLAKFFVRSLRGTYCSMAGDIEKGRTELDNYTGHLLRLAKDRTPAPLNEAVYATVSQMTKPDRAVIQKLVALM